MIEKDEIYNLIDKCRNVARNGLIDGRKSIIPEIKLIAIPTGIFVGVTTNPAIFVTHKTYKFYSQIPEIAALNLVANATILVQEQFFKKNNTVVLIGIIAHEMGHAFNVASNLYPNTEDNACIFEIGIMLRIYREGAKIMNAPLSKKDLTEYFKSRMSYFTKTTSNRILLKLVEFIQNPASDFMFSPFMPKTKSSSTLFANTPSPKTQSLDLSDINDLASSTVSKL